jgi:acetolactate synthase-1/3 small subunit
VTVRRTFVVELADDPGALNRVVSVLRQRSLNITSLSVAPGEVPGRSRLTLVAEAATAPRLAHRLRKEQPVLAAEEVTGRPSVEREVALLRVRATGEETARQIAAVADRWGGTVATATADAVIVEIAAHTSGVDRLAAALRPYGLLELARSGPVAMVHEHEASAREHARPVRSNEEREE